MNTCNVMDAAAFKALPQSEKAILVAKDCLQQIRLKRYRIRSGQYASRLKVSKIDPDVTLDQISTSSKLGIQVIHESNCAVCAKGSLFLSAVTKSNRMSLEELQDIVSFEDSDAMADKVCRVDKIFSQSDFDLIECAFETESHFGETVNNWKKCDQAVTFGQAHRADDMRMGAICLNIIANNGKFVPTENIPSEGQVRRAITLRIRKPKARK